MRREVIEFNGVKYYRYPDSNRESDRKYFKRQGKNLHRAIWESANGPIPKGCHIHHKDETPDNNNISNLECIQRSIHQSNHTRGKTTKAKNENLDRIRPLATEWHRSPEGRAWHSEHSREIYTKRERVVRTCAECGKEYENITYRESDRFCSNACKTTARRKSGVDDIDVTCPQCGKVFRKNKYARAVHCSLMCGRHSRK